HDHNGTLIERQTAEAAGETLGIESFQGGSSQEVTFVEPHGEAKAGLVGSILRMDVRAPQAVALLQAQRVEGAGASRDHGEPPASGRWARIQARSCGPEPLPVTTRKRSGPNRVTVRSHMIPPRSFNIAVYVTRPAGRSIWLAVRRWR